MLGFLGFVQHTNALSFCTKGKVCACILLRSDVYEAGLSSHRRGEVVKLHIRFSTSDVSWIERVVINSNFDQ